METKSIVICGVGGQGIILASDVLSAALYRSGFDVKKNEIHGMSQREGSVVSFIRFGKKVHSPVVPVGEADYLVGFEKLEALRNMQYLKKDGLAVVNAQEIMPTSVLLGSVKYPDNSSEIIRKKTAQFKPVNALDTAKAQGNPRAVNIVLLGVLSRYLDNVKDSAWEEAIRQFVKSRFVDSNLEAFKAGKTL